MPYGSDPTTPPTQGGYGKDPTTPPDAAKTPASGAFFGAAKLLPEGVQKLLPDFMSGPSVGEQLTAAGDRVAAEEKRLGRPLTLRERLAAEPATSSPVAMGFATNQLGGDVPVPKIGTAGRAEFARAAKPATGSIRAAGGREPYYGKMESAVQSIVENRENLHFADADGNIVIGELPKSLEQFEDAINQTKRELFQRYNALAQQAGMIGPQLDLRPIVAELTNISTDPVERMLRPEVANYAETRAKALSTQGSLYADQAQNAIQNLNGTLKSLYNGGQPTFDMVARANIDALIANKMRSGLDALVEQSVGPGYQDLKNQYGSLKAIENDVRRRSAVTAGQEKGGGILGRIADVASASEVLRGLATFSTERVATGIFLKTWERIMKSRRDPNRAVMNLFQRATERKVPPSPLSPIFPQSPANDALQQ